MDRINPDSLGALWLTVGLVGFLAVASFMVSFTGLHEVAAWAGLPAWLGWAVPMFIDVAILAYTLAVLIHRHRGEKTWASWLSLAGFTLFSVIANAAHALSIPHPDAGQQIIGAATAAMAPVAVFAATEQLGRLVIRRPEPPVSTAAPASVEPAPVLPGGRPGPDEHPVAGPEPSPAALETSELFEPAPGPVPEVETEVGLEVPGPGAGEEKEPMTHSPASVEAGPGVRPMLSVVGRKPRPSDFESWIGAVVASGEQPTGKSAAEFLGVSERTGRARLNALKKANPGLFTGEMLAEGTNSP
ncbi:DUF2637 domain-containing protein [Arthrobacter bambusae]